MDLDERERRSLLVGEVSNLESPDFSFEEQKVVSSDEHELLESYRRKYLYLLDRLPEGFLTEELKLRLTEIDTPSSLSSVCTEGMDNLKDFEEEMDDKKSIRELFYDVMIKKHIRFKPFVQERQDIINHGLDITVLENEEDFSEDEGQIGDRLDEKTVPQEGVEAADKRKKAEDGQVKTSSSKVKSKNKSSLSKILTEGYEEDADRLKTPSAVFLDFYPDSYLQELLQLDIDTPPEDVIDQYGVKSFKTILKESYEKDRGRTYALHMIACIFSYDNRPLADDELPIEQEIVDMVHNLNYNTVKPDRNTGIITGCVIVNNGLGILCLELSLFDAIRLVSTLKWSQFAQQVLKLKIFSTITFTTSKFKVFVMCRPLLIENDDREFPSFDDHVENANEEESEEVRAYLQEISIKFGQTFTVLGNQSEYHECGAGELPPCAVNQLPSRELLEWALDCPVLKDWNELMDDLLEPEPYYDYMNDSYPFPADTFNLRNLYFFDEHKDEFIELYKNGYRPKFGETEAPEIPVPPFFKPVAEECCEGRLKFVPVDMDNMKVLNQ